MTNDDASFIGDYFNAIPARRMQAYLYDTEEGGNETSYVITTTDWDQVRDYLVAERANNGRPYIVVQNADFEDRQELLLHHQFDGRELDAGYVKKTLPYLYYLWNRPVHLVTVSDDRIIQHTFDSHGRLSEDIIGKVE